MSEYILVKFELPKREGTTVAPVFQVPAYDVTIRTFPRGHLLAQSPWPYATFYHRDVKRILKGDQELASRLFAGMRDGGFATVHARMIAPTVEMTMPYRFVVFHPKGGDFVGIVECLQPLMYANEVQHVAAA